MVLPVRQRLGRAHHDRVSGVDPDRIQIFHVADGDGCVGGVPDHLIFDLLVTPDALLHEDFTHRREIKSRCQELLKLSLAVRKAPAGAAEREGGSEHHRVADLLRRLPPLGERMHHDRGQYRLPQSHAEVAEFLPVLRHLDAGRIRAQKLAAALFEDSLLLQLHSQVETGLTPDSRQDRVRPLGSDDTRDEFQRQRLHVDPVGDRPVRHDRSGVRVAQNDLIPFLSERQAGLGPRIVKLRRLSDDDGAGADHQYFLYIGSSGHIISFQQICITVSDAILLPIQCLS